MKGLWKQSGLAAMACADFGHLNPLGRSRRRARLVVYGFAVAFAALTAYIAFSSAPAGAVARGGDSWFGGVYASTAPYRSQISTFFSSIYPKNSSSPSPEPRGGPASGSSSEVSRDGDSSTVVGSRVGSRSSATDESTEQLGSGGVAPSSNAGGVSAPSAGNSAGTGTAAGQSGGEAPASNSAASGGAPISAADQNKENSVHSSSSQAGGIGGSPTSSPAIDRTVAKDDEKSDGSRKQPGSRAPTNNGAAGSGSMVKADAKDVVEVSSNSSAIGSDNQSVTGSRAPSGGSAAGNNTTAKADGKGVVGAASNGSAESGTVAKADLNNEADALPGSGNGDASHKSSASSVPAKNNTKDDGVEHNKVSRDVASTSNQSGSPAMPGEKEGGSLSKNKTLVASPILRKQNETSEASSGGSGSMANKKETAPLGSAGSLKDNPSQSTASKAANHSEVLVKGNGSSTKQAGGSSVNKKVDWIKEMAGCDMFHGSWVQDNSYPLYPGGSCPHIDEPFDCHLNGRPDRGYQKLRWQPSGCSIPRLNPTDMLERLRGKRLVFVGDSLNRNMWESLVCILRHSVRDKRKVFEASGRREFKTEGSYSFLFTDYNCSVEFFRSPFLVQEWEMRVSNGNKKETLRLDIVEQSSPKYKDADFIIFNTGHWWTHEKTALGKDYYQEGNHIYSELNVVDAFRKALVTWSKWIDANVNPKKTTVMFRGYSASHFSGGQWNSGGSCDKETEPIKNEQYLSTYPPKMSILEDVIHKMKTPVVYLNITRLTDYRKDAHPSIYRKQHLTEEERRSPERYQDCSHWCLPGVPDSWNELVYAQLLIRQHQMLQQ
ncbi:protein trichome birefringence-like 1 isoform X2 [Brachypodium distachyon]|uniref:Uncharacterized protein n=1 Tax=Brachypodium distachyon TaxID=15368 RepID=A0A0Q3H8U8_BRADI|nr:protein trichome birefringence-like 1 isoform X2 [Brachypodium distachyon]KQK19084.1 hypothetical protein BRADI_1g46280v3 [Brachypodium distachyon]KQK19085.1 hypothetical protein BRADI_1g46280v3 [Brachypodium distachyon]PNT76243.1 hypothetical protein BRADI_1g46280v3 [Brachypodium distachyon]|eukprot:XP_003560946.2 protein trichome birefringence-like 1 isoform X2 [Brachypodium distachyon]